MHFLTTLTTFLSVTSVAVSQTLYTDDRYIKNAFGKKVQLRCVNWAGHGEVNIPEGLHAQSISYITSWIRKNNFNCVRLTYAIDMALNPHQPLKQAFKSAADSTGLGKNLTDLYPAVIRKNPLLLLATTRSTFAAVITSLGLNGIMVILDNHNSKAGWCCSTDDGNGWPDVGSGYIAQNSRNFNTENWYKGLEAMARFGRLFPNVVGYALRNELRAIDGQDNADWYEFVPKAAAAVHKGDPNGLVVIGGINYALDMSFLRTKNLDRKAIGIEKKTLWEFHTYSWSNDQTANCPKYQPILDEAAGFLLESRKPWTGPLWLSEFGWAQNGATSTEVAYYSCVADYVATRDIGWAYWALQGTYYVREGQVAYDEGFGLLNKDWSDWRNASFPSIMAKAWK